MRFMDSECATGENGRVILGWHLWWAPFRTRSVFLQSLAPPPSEEASNTWCLYFSQISVQSQMQPVSLQDILGRPEMRLESVVSHKCTTENTHLTNLHAFWSLSFHTFLHPQQYLQNWSKWRAQHALVYFLLTFNKCGHIIANGLAGHHADTATQTCSSKEKSVHALPSHLLKNVQTGFIFYSSS